MAWACQGQQLLTSGGETSKKQSKLGKNDNTGFAGSPDAGRAVEIVSAIWNIARTPRFSFLELF